MAARPAVEVDGLRKAFGGPPVLDGLDLVVAPGTVLALLGANGAGKTTTVRILATLLRPDAGSARVAGFDVLTERPQVRRRLSVTGQSTAVDGLLTGAENLVTVARLAGLGRRAARDRADGLLAAVDLTEAGDRRARTYSGGMRRRLDLALGLVTVPEVMLLDEPTTGLDPRSRQGVWDAVAALAARGTAVLLTTQHLEEADRLASRVAVVDHGRVVAEDAPAALKARVSPRRLDLVLRDGDAHAQAVRRLGDAVLAADAGALTLSAPAPDARAVRAVLERADPDGDRVVDLAVRETSLDEVFLALTGRAVDRPDGLHRTHAPGREASHA